MKNTILSFCLTLMLVGCANLTKEQSHTMMWLGTAADVLSTNDAMNRGCVEGNPFLGGEDANIGTVFLANVIVTGGFSYAIEQEWISPDIAWVIAPLKFGVAYHNMTIDCQ